MSCTYGHCAEPRCKLLLGRPRVQQYLRQHFQGACLTLIVDVTNPLVEYSTQHHGRIDFEKSRVVQAFLLLLNLLFVHPMMLVACGVYPPLVAGLKLKIPEVRVLPKDGKMRLGAHMIHRVPLITNLTGVFLKIVLALQARR